MYPKSGSHKRITSSESEKDAADQCSQDESRISGRDGLLVSLSSKP